MASFLRPRRLPAPVHLFHHDVRRPAAAGRAGRAGSVASEDSSEIGSADCKAKRLAAARIGTHRSRNYAHAHTHTRTGVHTHHLLSSAATPAVSPQSAYSAAQIAAALLWRCCSILGGTLFLFPLLLQDPRLRLFVQH